jgi:hypothetical protein
VTPDCWVIKPGICKKSCNFDYNLGFFVLKWLVNYFFSFDVRRKFPELSSSNHLTTAKTLLRLITGGKKTLGWGFPCSPLGSILQRFLTWRKTRAIYIRRKRHLGQKTLAASV